MSLEDRLKEERLKLGLNQADFGAACGVTKKTQIDYEKGNSSPTGKQLELLSAVGADVNYIITGNRDAFSNDERELIELYRSASLKNKMQALNVLLGQTNAGVNITASDAAQTAVGDHNVQVSGDYLKPDSNISQQFNGKVGQVAGRDLTINKKKK